MRFLIDAQLPPALARSISAHGYPADHLVDVGLLHARDSEIWDYAHQHSLVILTKDEDFANFAIQRKNHVAVVWLRFRNASKQQILSQFNNCLPAIEKLIQKGEFLIEIR